MSIFHEFDNLRNTVNQMLSEFDAGLRTGGGRRGRRAGRQQQQQQGLLGGLGGMEDMLDMGDMGWTPLLIGGGDIGQGQQQMQGGGKGLEESKMQDVDVPQQVGGSTAVGQVSQQPKIGTQMQTFLPDRFLPARINIEDAKDKFIVTADCPGFDKENIKVNVSDDGILHLKAEQSKEWCEKSKDKKYLKTERVFSNLERHMRVPKGVDTAKIAANYENGVLHVVLPKTPEAEQKKTDIQIA